MTFTVDIELAGEPVGKGRGRAFAHKGTGKITVMTPSKTRTYEAQLRYAGQCQMAGREPTRLPCSVVVDVFVQAPQAPKGGKAVRAEMLGNFRRPTKKPDIDNYAKTVADALNGVVWADDSQIVDLSVHKWWAEHPKLRVMTIARPESPREARPTLDERLLPQ